MSQPSRHIIYSELYQKEAYQWRSYLFSLGYKEPTIQARYLWLKEFFTHLEKRRIYQLTHITTVEIIDFHQYIQNRKSFKEDKNLSKKMVYDIMRCIQQYLGYILHIGKIKINPASHLKFRFPQEKVERKIFTRQEIRELYRITQTLQEQALLHLAYGCGLRVKELSQLNKEDLRLSENQVIVQKGKNNKRRIIPIVPKMAEELQEFIQSTDPDQQAIFLNYKGRRMQQWTFNRELKNLIKRTEFGKKLTQEQLNKIGIHSLRHSIATHLLAGGMKLPYIQNLLGHSHIESTEVYTHITQEQINTLQ